MIGTDFGLTWLPGSHELAVQSGSKTIVAVDVASGMQRQLFSSAPWDIGSNLYVSPDGHSLAFVEASSDQGRVRVIPLDPDGLSVPMPFESDECALHGWHPDGRSVIETRTNDNTERDDPEHDQLWRVPLDGSSMEPLGVFGSNLLYASLSPDGRRVAYGTEIFGAELWLLRPNNGSRR